MHYAVILNPTAHSGAAGRRRRILEKALQKAHLNYELFVTKAPGHAVRLAREVAAGTDAVVAAGGDGTVQEVAQGLLEGGQTVPLGILPMGTGNDFVRMLGIPRRMRKAVQVLTEASPRDVDYGVVSWREEEARKQQVFVNTVGVGLDASVAQAVAAFKRLPGRMAYLAGLLQAFRRWETPQARVLAGPIKEATLAGSSGAGEDWLLTARDELPQSTLLYEGPLLLAAIGNGKSAGGGFHLTPQASVVDGRLDGCIVENLPVYRLLRLLPEVVRERHGAFPEVHMYQAQAFYIEVTPGMPVHADGEVVGQTARCVAVEVKPAGLSVLTSSSFF